MVERIPNQPSLGLPIEVTNSLSNGRAAPLMPMGTSEAEELLKPKGQSRETLLEEVVSDSRVETRKLFEGDPEE